MYQLARFTAFAVAVGVTVGCGNKGDAPAYANVSGTVTYNGKPLDKGQITFSTEGRPPTAMDVVDGKFAGQAMIGSNRVQVAAYRKSAKERNIPESARAQVKAYQAMNKGGGSSDTNSMEMEDYIPPEWGSDSKQMRVVESGGANKFEFDIKGK